jgi:hypothetical protein
MMLIIDMMIYFKRDKSIDDSVASSGTEAGLRDHVMRLKSRDVAKMAVYRAG